MTRENYKKAVLAKIDEISPYENVDIIWDLLMEQVLNEACNNFLMICPLHLIDTSNIPTYTFVNNDDGTGFIRLPKDFLRLSQFKMKDWQRPVIVPITQESPRYNLQKDKYTRGGVAKPVCALVEMMPVSTTYLTTVLELFPIYYDWTENDIEKALYIKQTLPENLQDNLLSGAQWYTASQLLLQMNQQDFAKVAQMKFEEFIKLNSSRG